MRTPGAAVCTRWHRRGRRLKESHQQVESQPWTPWLDAGRSQPVDDL